LDFADVSFAPLREGALKSILSDSS
jgi:hypothetical protein